MLELRRNTEEVVKTSKACLYGESNLIPPPPARDMRAPTSPLCCTEQRKRARYLGGLLSTSQGRDGIAMVAGELNLKANA